MKGEVVSLRSVTSVSQRSGRESAQTMCYHCGLAVPKHTRHYLVIEGVERPMCCIGCVAVAELLMGSLVEECDTNGAYISNLDLG